FKERYIPEINIEQLFFKDPAGNGIELIFLEGYEMIRKVTGIYATYCTRNSTPLGLAKKALYWQKTKELGSTTLTSTPFDNSEKSLSDMNQGLTGNQDNVGKNLNFFLKSLSKATVTENSIENPMSKSPVPTK
nr:hypothetical protein [Gammaproteobacteria bacterium]